MSNEKEHIVHCLAFPSPDEYDDKQPLTSKEEEERRIAELGRPILGEHTKLEVIIEESYEFKVCQEHSPPGRPAHLGPAVHSVGAIFKIHLKGEGDVISDMTGVFFERGLQSHSGVTELEKNEGVL